MERQLRSLLLSAVIFTGGAILPVIDPIQDRDSTPIMRPASRVHLTTVSQVQLERDSKRVVAPL